MGWRIKGLSVPTFRSRRNLKLLVVSIVAVSWENGRGKAWKLFKIEVVFFFFLINVGYY